MCVCIRHDVCSIIRMSRKTATFMVEFMRGNFQQSRQKMKVKGKNFVLLG